MWLIKQKRTQSACVIVLCSLILVNQPNDSLNSIKINLDFFLKDLH